MLKEAWAESVAESRKQAAKKYPGNKTLQEYGTYKGVSGEFKKNIRKKAINAIGKFLGI